VLIRRIRENLRLLLVAEITGGLMATHGAEQE
jgi:hypothetical protein